LKYINKQECIKSGTLRNIFRERMIIQELDHVFILNLRYAFQDEENLFFVMDWAKGGDLDFNLKRTQVLSLHTIRIYAAEIASALHYLHSHSIIHR
jgi:serine/threonine kinase 32